MRARLAAAMVAWACAGPLAAAAPADDDARRVFARVAPAVVTVLLFDEQGQSEGHGSGVVVGAGLVATNCHVVQEAAALRVAAQAGQFDAKWVRQDPQRDLCILAVDGLRAPAPALRRGDTLVVGEPVVAVGNPLGFGLAASAGLVVAVDAKDGQTAVIASAAQSPGSSGGGLFDRDARLVGITTAVLGTGQNLNLALAADALERLAAAGPAPRPRPAVPVPERRWRDEAAALTASEDWPGLEALARAWQAAQPLAAAAPAALALAQSGQQRQQEAVASVRQALALDEHHAFHWLLLAGVLRAAGQAEPAEQALLRAEHLQPSIAAPHATRADWRLDDGQLAPALREIKEALRLEPGVESSWRTLGRIEDARGDAAAAAQLLAADGKTDEAARLTAQAGQDKLETARTLLAIGKAELQRGRLGPAQDAVRKATALAPDSAEAWGVLGVVLDGGGQADEAERAYDRALALAPAAATFTSETLTNRALLRRKQGRKAAALDDLRRARAIDPAYVPAWRNYGLLMEESKDYREAAAAFGQIDALGKASADDLVTLGEMQGALGDAAGGLKTLARAEAANPRLVRMCLSTARLLNQRHERLKSLGYLERALEVEPTSHVAWSSKGFVLGKLDRLPEAVAALETAVRLAPDFANAWINLGEAQLRSKKLGRAIEALEKAAALQPDATDARLFLSQAYLAARLLGKSREQSQRLLDQHPDLPPALGLLAMSYLMEGNATAARTPYLRLKTVAPAMARSLRDQGVAGGVAAAKLLPE